MSKLACIRKTLASRSDIKIVKTKEKKYQLRDDRFPHQFIKFFIAPKSKAISFAECRDMLDKLNLIPNVTPDYDYRKEVISGFEFAPRLWYDETIGQVVISKEIIFTDEELKTLEGLVDGKRKIREVNKLTRRIVVVLCKNEKEAEKQFEADQWMESPAGGP